MSISDVLYRVMLDDSSAKFDVAPSVRTGCHVIVGVSGLMADRKRRWLITVRDRRNRVSQVQKHLPVLINERCDHRVSGNTTWDTIMMA